MCLLRSPGDHPIVRKHGWLSPGLCQSQLTTCGFVWHSAFAVRWFVSYRGTGPAEWHSATGFVINMHWRNGANASEAVPACGWLRPIMEYVCTTWPDWQDKVQNESGWEGRYGFETIAIDIIVN